MPALIPRPDTVPHTTDLERIFEEQHGRVFSAAYRITGSAQDAQDVLQTVFLRLLRRGKALDLSPNPGSYLHRAAINAALDLLRSRTRARSLPLDDFEERLAESSVSDPLRQQEDRELRHLLRQAVLALSERNALVFSLRYFEGAGTQDIAEKMGMSTTHVRVTLHRARGQVKKELNALLGGR